MYERPKTTNHVVAGQLCSFYSCLFKASQAASFISQTQTFIVQCNSKGKSPYNIKSPLVHYDINRYKSQLHVLHEQVMNREM